MGNLLQIKEGETKAGFLRGGGRAFLVVQVKDAKGRCKREKNLSWVNNGRLLHDGTWIGNHER